MSGGYNTAGCGGLRARALLSGRLLPLIGYRKEWRQSTTARNATICYRMGCEYLLLRGMGIFK